MIYLKLFLTAVFWGGTFIAGRILAQEVQPWSGSFLRFLVASVGMIPWSGTSRAGCSLFERRRFSSSSSRG